ncbi:hypothetical protein [Microlunatus sagamiharensis]|uniref:hypothetical protein n=1 Tax=Microlunatus sagamiharensis TaxID=546874 RepID=UPI000B84FA59|nr:hypothetical protein [Microlunatus sagamiharensis]
MTPTAGTSTARPATTPRWALLLVGVAAAAVGLLPWLATGARLLIQNLWATDATPETMPRALLPFSQYTITTIIGVVVVGAALAGLCARALARRLPRLGTATVATGVLAVHVTALLQTASVVRAGLREGTESFVYVTALEAVALLSVLVGVGALALVERAGRAGAVLGLAVGALALGPWLSALLVLVDGGTTTLLGAARLATWVPAALVGAAIGWSGVRTAGRALATAVALVLVAVVPALTTAISSSAGSRVLAHDPREMAAYAVQVFLGASTTPALVLPPLAVALGAAVVVGVLLGPVRRGREQ